MQDLRQRFQAADKQTKGVLNANQLQQVTYGPGQVKLSQSTIRTLLHLMDQSGKNVLSFNEFVGLDQFVKNLSTAYGQQDPQNTGKLNVDGVVRGLQAEGYQLDRTLVEMLCRKIPAVQTPTWAPGKPWPGQLTFDDFVLVSAKLAAAKAAFTNRAQGKPSVTLDFNQFMALAAEF